MLETASASSWPNDAAQHLPQRASLCAQPGDELVVHLYKYDLTVTPQFIRNIPAAHLFHPSCDVVMNSWYT